MGVLWTPATPTDPASYPFAVGFFAEPANYSTLTTATANAGYHVRATYKNAGHNFGFIWDKNNLPALAPLVGKLVFLSGFTITSPDFPVVSNAGIFDSDPQIPNVPTKYRAESSKSRRFVAPAKVYGDNATISIWWWASNDGSNNNKWVEFQGLKLYDRPLPYMWNGLNWESPRVYKDANTNVVPRIMTPTGWSEQI